MRGETFLICLFPVLILTDTTNYTQTEKPPCTERCTVRLKHDVLSGNLTADFLNELIVESKCNQEELYTSKITLVNLDNVNISTIEPDTFKNFTCLNYLSIKNNTVTDITNVYIPQSLEDLHLEYNELFIPPDKTLLKDDKLNINLLNLQNCKITKLYNETFSNLEKLQILQLQNNNITELPEKVFNRNYNLIKLNLTNNMIFTLPIDLFINNKKIQLMSFDNNNFDENAPIYNEIFSHINNVTVKFPSNIILSCENASCVWNHIYFVVTNKTIEDENSTEDDNTTTCVKCHSTIIPQEEVFNASKQENNKRINTIQENDIAEFGMYAWIYFAIVMLVQFILVIIALTIYINDTKKIE